MARPREFVRVIDGATGPVKSAAKGVGRETGLSFHKGSGQYYSLAPDGSRQYLGRELLAALAAIGQAPPEPFEPFAASSGIGSMIDAATAVAAKQTVEAPRPVAPNREPLSACLDIWRQFAAAKGRSPRHMAETVAAFEAFCEALGDKPVNQICKSDFGKYELRLAKRSNHCQLSTWRRIGAVLRLALRKSDLALPDGLMLWLTSIDKPAYQPKATNKEPLPVALFDKLLKRCKKLASLKPETMPTNTREQWAKKAQAIWAKRMGIQFDAILRLMLNCSLDPIDVCRLEWKNLVDLDGKAYLDFPRIKVARKVGLPIDRKTPLLPSTVKSLKTWRAYERTESPLAFRTSTGSQWDSKQLTAAFRRIKSKCGYVEKDAKYLDEQNRCIWSLKHLRNVGPTVRRDAGLPVDMSDAILGHTLNLGTSKFYTGQFGADYLLPLVKAIGKQYGVDGV